MAERSLKMSAVVTLLMVALAVAIPTEDKKAAAASSQSSANTPPFPVSADSSRTFINIPTCRPGLCPFIKKAVPDSLAHPDSPHNPAPSLCGNMCVNDVSCPVGQRCCPTHCGYVCHPIIVMAPSTA